MELVEIRDLDGPNMFALVPTIKLEVKAAPDERLESARQSRIQESLGVAPPEDAIAALMTVVAALHKRAELPAPEVTSQELDLPGHVAVCFPWEHRAAAMAVASTSFQLAAGEIPDDLNDALLAARDEDPDEDDQPTWVRDVERRIPIAAITGTNGKTTTTRLLTHIVRSAGYRTGWSSSTGVYIEGDQVLEGDYTGHGGARRVLNDPDVEYGILETARGGMLLRGLGFESNDVGIFLNVSPDHIGLHGVTRLETLARVKSTVVRVTRPGGVAVLNADDPLVLAQSEHLAAEPVLISRQQDNQEVARHLERGGRAVVLSDGEIALVSGDVRTAIAPLDQVPMTYAGGASHMVENALAAVAGAIGLGIGHEDIRRALRSFHPDTEHNAGRLNVFEIDGRILVIDYAHNESGLNYLFDFAEALFPTSCRVTAVVGTAGDRSDDVFMNLGRFASERAHRVITKENPRFHRGREPGEATRLLQQGIQAAGAEQRYASAYEREYDALMTALDSSEPGETILVMCIEDYLEILEEIQRRGARPHAPFKAVDE